MYLQHADDIWRAYPELVPGVLAADGIQLDVDVDQRIRTYNAIARDRLGSGSESELAEIQAWRRAFSRMGLKPTQYRCAAESLLRRFRKEGSLPRIHPLIDLCNAISLAFAIPIAAIDRSRIADFIEVRHATGDEQYETFSGQVEHPEPREVIFADNAGRAHARRWTNRQSGYSAIRDTTSDVLIVAEAMHETAPQDVAELIATLTGEIGAIWSIQVKTAILTPPDPRFEF